MSRLYTDSDWDIQDATSSGSVLCEREQSGGWKRVASNRLLFYGRCACRRSGLAMLVIVPAERPPGPKALTRICVPT